MAEGVEIRIEDGIARLTLSRPEVLNALTFEMYAELERWFESEASNRAIRCVVLTGAGRGFCSGGDVKRIIAPLLEMGPAELEKFGRMTCETVRNMRLFPRPIVASVNGIAAGAGSMLALASDLRICSDQARFSFLFVKVGLSGADMGAAWLLPRIVGFGRATQLLMTGEVIDAAEAHRIGLANRVVPHDSLAAETDRLARTLAQGPATGLRITKEALNKEAHVTLGEALDYEAVTQAKCMLTEEYREGYRAFMEKRPPDFSRIPDSGLRV